MAEKKKEAKGKKGKGKKEKKDKKENPRTDDIPSSPPRLKEIKSQTVTEGEKLVLKCEVASDQPGLKFKWFKEDKEIGGKNKAESKPVNIKIRKKKKSSELHITSASDTDGGEYKCTVSNQLGNNSMRVNVTIIRKKICLLFFLYEGFFTHLII